MNHKPMVIVQKGRKYFLYINGQPVVKNGKSLDSAGLRGQPMPPGLKPHAFKTKREAEGIAHQAGRYVLNLGDMLYAYVEYVDATVPKKGDQNGLRNHQPLVHCYRRPHVRG
jgi:hypothetical protein